jgi:hypothetical protein
VSPINSNYYKLYASHSNGWELFVNYKEEIDEL